MCTLYIFTVLVKLVLLRDRGAKRDKAAVKADQGVVGDWSCRPQQRRGEDPVLWAWCMAPGSATVLVKPLKFARLKVASHRGMVIVGTEVDVETNRPGPSYLQAWWLRPLPPPPQVTPQPAITLLPDLEKIRHQLALEVQ